MLEHRLLVLTNVGITVPTAEVMTHRSSIDYDTTRRDEIRAYLACAQKNPDVE